MPTIVLILIAIVVAVSAMGALSIIRWREAKRLEFARLVVHHTDTVAVLNSVGETLEAWLSPLMMQFIASTILHHHQKLIAAKAPENRIVSAARENAANWQQLQRPAKRSLPGSTQVAQQMREAVRSLLASLKQAYTEKLIISDDVKTLLDEAKTLNISITLAVFQEKANTAIRLHNYFQASHYLARAVELLTQQEELPSDLVPVLADIRQRLKECEEHKKEEKAHSVNRLEAGAAKLTAEDESWKKKTF